MSAEPMRRLCASAAACCAALLPAVTNASPEADPRAPAEAQAVVAPADHKTSTHPTTTAPAKQVRPAAPVQRPPAATTGGSAPAKQTRRPHHHPLLVLAGGPIIGPHAIGNEQCSTEEVVCERGGRFFGVGGTVELRARVWRPLYLHVRFMTVANVLRERPVFAGMLAPSVGFGAYGRHAFLRGEYMFVHPIGDGRFAPPLTDERTARARWGRHAGSVTAGVRHHFTERLAGEAWAGIVIGPREQRTVQNVEERRLLLSFLVGLGVSWDLVVGGKSTPAPVSRVP